MMYKRVAATPQDFMFACFSALNIRRKHIVTQDLSRVDWKNFYQILLNIRDDKKKPRKMKAIDQVGAAADPDSKKSGLCSCCRKKKTD